MASAWGDSWGSAWGDSWGSVSTTTQGTGGAAVFTSRKLGQQKKRKQEQAKAMQKRKRDVDIAVALWMMGDES